MNTTLCLPNLGRVSCWSSSDLFDINSAEQYQIRILGHVLDQIYDIPVDNSLPNLQHQPITSAAAAESAPPDYTPPYPFKSNNVYVQNSQDFRALSLA